RSKRISLDLVGALFVDPSAAVGGLPIHAGDGLMGHFVQVPSIPCCTEPDAATAEARAALQQGDPGVVSAIDQMVTRSLDLNTSNGGIPLSGPGAMKLTGFLRVDVPGVGDFFRYQGCTTFMRLRVGGRTVFESSMGGRDHRSVYFPVSGLY